MSLFRRGWSQPCGLLLALALLPICRSALAQEIILKVNYVCNGERLVVDGCDIHDLSDTSYCFVGHPDHVKDGLMAYSSSTRGALKKLLPTCKQPSQQEIAAHEAFVKRQESMQAEAERRANGQMPANQQQQQQMMAQTGQMSPEQRKTARCVSSGRVPAVCTGNALLRGFDELTGHLMSQIQPDLKPGPELSGAFAGAGGWRIEFADRGASLTCAGLAPDPYGYQIEMRGDRAYVTLNTRPKPTTLALNAEGALIGQGPMVIDGRVITGYRNGGGGGGTPGHYESQQVTSHQELTPLEATPYAGNDNLSRNGGTYDLATTSTQSTYVPGSPAPSGPVPIYAAKRASCAAPQLSSKNAGTTGVQAATGLMTALFNGGDKGPPTPPGIRMRGIFASAATGFSAEFYPESVVLGCGPDAARAYPYTVHVEGNRAVVAVEAPDRPLKLALNADGSLDPGSTAAYQVHGRVITGENGDNFTFAPLERSCDLAMLTPAKEIPAAVSGRMNAAASIPAVATGPADASLSIRSGLQAAPGQANPLSNLPYVLLKTSFDQVVRSAGVMVPAGTLPVKYFVQACANRSPDCLAIVNSYKGNAIGGMRSDAAGNATLPPLPAGTYYLFISARLGTEAWMWLQPVEIHSGRNQLVLDERNGTRVQ